MPELDVDQLPSRLGLATNPAQLRRDAWTELHRITDRIADQHGAGDDVTALRARAHDLVAGIGPFERFWTFPGIEMVEHLDRLLDDSDAAADLARVVDNVTSLLNTYGDRAALLEEDEVIDGTGGFERTTPHYFTLLIADRVAPGVAQAVRHELLAARSGSDDFVFEVLLVDNIEDAATAVVANGEINACIIRDDLPLRSDNPLPIYQSFFDELEAAEVEQASSVPRGIGLARLIRQTRPHLDLYALTDQATRAIGSAGYELFDRTFFGLDDAMEIFVTVLDGIRRRYTTPLLDSLMRYAKRPIGNFHALPIARGNSIFTSRWIEDMGEFYGRNIFMAETSSTSGGLDSLLSPTGAIRESMEAAARTWGSMKTFFATNGTSTSNKIVVQALTKPGDIVLIDRNCHKSHHYGLVLGGANPLYLDAYPLTDYSIYGAVPLRTIKRALLDLRRAGELDRVKMVLLTNCTFDGMNYNVGRFMEEILAIKPDMVFLWDEAWFAFSPAMPLVRDRTAMYTARRLEARYTSEEYRAEYAAYGERMAELDPDDDATWMDHPLMPDPDLVRVRAYSTHSTHKSLSALRQGSMMHVYDQDFERLVADNFTEAYLTHTSTSPNYQIIASLDLARRQLELEGYEKVSAAYEMAFTFRRTVATDPLLSKYFSVLGPEQLVPAELRASGLSTYDDWSAENYRKAIEAYEDDEFVLDATRVTLYLSDSGFNGAEFRDEILMDQHGIQVNKTSINTVLFIFTIGVTWSSLAALLDALRRIAADLDTHVAQAGEADRRLFERQREALTSDLPDLPDFSEFHRAFRPNPDTPNGDMRSAYFLNYGSGVRDYVPLTDADERIKAGETLVSSNFVVPYPPGFPVLVPGQVVSAEIVEFMQKLDVDEVHGYRSALGLSVFTEAALQSMHEKEGS